MFHIAYLQNTWLKTLKPTRSSPSEPYNSPCHGECFQQQPIRCGSQHQTRRQRLTSFHGLKVRILHGSALRHTITMEQCYLSILRENLCKSISFLSDFWATNCQAIYCRATTSQASQPASWTTHCSAAVSHAGAKGSVTCPHISIRKNFWGRCPTFLFTWSPYPAWSARRRTGLIFFS